MTNQTLCPHGNPVDAIEITSYGDTRPQYIATQCDCPRPHCPLCGTELASDGRCRFPVPVPDVH